MHYFAYGSNMNLEHMRRLCGWHFYVVSVGRLPDYEFGPDTRGYANVRRAPGKQVYGVLYEIDESCLGVLDEFEGYPDVFARHQVEVEGEDGKKYSAWVYAEAPEFFGQGGIKQEYMRRVLAGAEENRLPEKWVGFLSEFLHN